MSSYTAGSDRAAPASKEERGRYGFSWEQWTKTRDAMQHILRKCAEEQRTIAYSDLVQRVGPIRFEPDSHGLAAMLGEISTEEHDLGRGMLSVVVVHKEGDMMPGPGFFQLAERLGHDVSDKLAFWTSEFKRVLASNRKS